ncbi:YpoC family protein [Staphylococcus massiliensis]|uniref:YpoC family protein n=1 Tax=Staphylococcus massiliensis TaxID=555791 RepID=UPI001EE021C9|nr:hypothetical protein [Staphylococcus massiliensis]MCG3412248.1 hypothetical protein [Staphylococcus massiliensis]
MFKEKFSQLESELDEMSKLRQLKTESGKALLDQYFDLLMAYFKDINEIEDYDAARINALPVVPMNFEERLSYIELRKHHFMGYQQMKTMKQELIKMNASYQIRKKRQ